MIYLLVAKSGNYLKTNVKKGTYTFVSQITKDCCFTVEEFNDERFQKAWDKAKQSFKGKIYGYQGAPKNNYELKDFMLLSNDAKAYVVSKSFKATDNRTKTTVAQLKRERYQKEREDMGIASASQNTSQIDSIEAIAKESKAKKTDKPSNSVQAILSAISESKHCLEEEKDYDNYVITEVSRLITDVLHYIALFPDKLEDEKKLMLFSLLEGAVKKINDIHVNELYRGLLEKMVNSTTESVGSLLQTYDDIKKITYSPRTLIDFFTANGKVTNEPYIPTFDEWFNEIIVQKNDKFSSKELLDQLKETEQVAERPIEHFEKQSLFDVSRLLPRRLTKKLEGQSENEERADKTHGKKRIANVDASVGKNQRSQLSTYTDKEGYMHFAGSTMTVKADDFKDVADRVDHGTISMEDGADELGMKVPNFSLLYTTYSRGKNAFAKQQVIKANKEEFAYFKTCCQSLDTTIQRQIEHLITENPTPEMLPLKKEDAKVSNVFMKVDTYKDFFNNPENKGKDLSLCLGELVHEYVADVKAKKDACTNTTEQINVEEYLEKHPDTTCPFCHCKMVAESKKGIIKCKKCKTRAYSQFLNINLTEKDMEEVLKNGRSTTITSVYNPVWFGTEDVVQGTFAFTDGLDGKHMLTFEKL